MPTLRRRGSGSHSSTTCVTSLTLDSTIALNLRPAAGTTRRRFPYLLKSSAAWRQAGPNFHCDRQHPLFASLGLGIDAVSIDFVAIRGRLPLGLCSSGILPNERPLEQPERWRHGSLASAAMNSAHGGRVSCRSDTSSRCPYRTVSPAAAFTATGSAPTDRPGRQLTALAQPPAPCQ